MCKKEKKKMQLTSGFKGIKISNTPSQNLREQFYNHYHMVKSNEFINEIKNWKPGNPINTSYITWHYWPNQLFTFLTQLTIIGLESYISSAVYFKLGQEGRLKENIEFIKNPFSIEGKGGTVAKYYKLMPSLYLKEIALSSCNSRLWQDLKVFYKEIRNPLFHGKQLDTSDPHDLINIFEIIADVYEWIDSWHNPDDIIPGSGWVTKLKRT